MDIKFERFAINGLRRLNRWGFGRLSSKKQARTGGKAMKVLVRHIRWIWNEAQRMVAPGWAVRRHFVNIERQ
jgi:hypothetical protein